MKYLTKFKHNPSVNYSFGIAASWAGAGSLIVGMTMISEFGFMPFLLWAFGNFIACIVFGVLANRYIYLKKVFTSSIVQLIIGVMCVLQLWVNMSGVHDSLIIISPEVALAVTYAIGIGFLLLYLKFAMIRNVLTDSLSWKIVYILIAIIAVVSICINGVTIPSLGFDTTAILDGLHKCIALIPAAFFYPYFWKLFEYNKDNTDGVHKVNMVQCFINGAGLFGIYLCFVFILGITTFGPVLNILKGILIATIAMSSLTTFIYSIYITFGKKVGFAVNLGGLISWYFLIPLGVLGAWSMMSDCRLVMMIVFIAAAIIWWYHDKAAGGAKPNVET